MPKNKSKSKLRDNLTNYLNGLLILAAVDYARMKQNGELVEYTDKILSLVSKELLKRIDSEWTKANSSEPPREFGISEVKKIIKDLGGE